MTAAWKSRLPDPQQRLPFEDNEELKQALFDAFVDLVIVGALKRASTRPFLPDATAIVGRHLDAQQRIGAAFDAEVLQHAGLTDAANGGIWLCISQIIERRTGEPVVVVCR